MSLLSLLQERDYNANTNRRYRDCCVYGVVDIWRGEGMKDKVWLDRIEFNDGASIPTYIFSSKDHDGFLELHCEYRESTDKIVAILTALND